MFDVVYSYADWTDREGSDLHLYEAQQQWFLYSLDSWEAIKVPKRLVLFADKSIIKLCKNLKVLSRFDEIVEVDWKKELIQDRKVNFFAYPKMWTMQHLVRPSFICDTDMVVFPKLFQAFDYSVEAFIKYSYWCTNNWNGDLEVKEKLCRNLELVGGKANWLKNCCNGGLTFWPDPNIAYKVADRIFQFGRKLALIVKKYPLLDNWVLYEEALLCPLTSIYTNNRVQTSIENDCWWEGAGDDGTIAEFRQRLEEVKAILYEK